MKRIKLGLIILVVVVIAFNLTACGGGAAPEKPTSPPEPAKQEEAAPTMAPEKVEPTKAPPAEAPTAPAATSKFPVPPNAKIIQSTDAITIASINMNIKDAMDWYRSDAKTKGWTEYELLTTVADNVFSMAFRIPNQEEEMIVQGTVISADNLTISIRYEEADVK